LQSPSHFSFPAADSLEITGEVRDQQSHKTVFKSADESQIDNPTVTPAPQKVPGE